MLSLPQAVKEQILHTWPLFFARHGRFTPVQLQAIPPILNGRHTLLVAATASGKTEAVLAPLLERNWKNLQKRSNLVPNLPVPQSPSLRLLYICPTRALVRDLYERLQPILADTGITVGMKTGDVALSARVPAILITTPESTDSLLTRSPRLFTELQAIVLDEIHLFDGTARGDHLRCLLPRLDYIRQYAHPESELAQRAALSATVPDPAGVASRYLHEGLVVNVPGGREIVADIAPLYSLAELVDALGQRPSHKSLIFCNSREEVEATAVYLRQHLPYYADIFVHYSNLDAQMRLEVEEQFAAAATAVCISTSTLELGIDIGSIDDVILLGAPTNLDSFLQRIGRGSRRTHYARVLCMPKSPGEWARFEALLALAQEVDDPQSPTPISEATQSPHYAFRPSILIQQTFSLIRQSPTGSIRLADLRRLAPPEVASEDIRKILTTLSFGHYLRSGRIGEWKPDRELQELLDKHEIYTNIGADVGSLTAVDAHSGRTIAQTDTAYPPGTVVLFGGKTMRVTWVEKYRFGLAAVEGAEIDAILRYAKSSIAIPFNVAQAVARSLDLQAGQMTFLPQEQGMTLFHFWGTVWGKLLAAILVENGLLVEFINEYSLAVSPPLTQLPPHDEQQVQKVAKATADPLATYLEMGRFHKLLPGDVAQAATLNQLNLPQFSQVYAATKIIKRNDLFSQLDLLL